MMYGVSMYSYLLGNITTLLTGIHQSEIHLREQMGKLEMIAKEASFPYDLYNKIKRIIKNNNKHNIYNKIDIDTFIDELPYEYKNLIIGLLNKKIINKLD